MRTIYDGLSFEVVKEAETFLGTRGITSSATGEANLTNYTPHGSDHTRGTRYYYIPDNAQRVQTTQGEGRSNAAPTYGRDHTSGTRYYYIPNYAQGAQAQHSAIPADRTKGVRTYLYLNGERVAVNNLYNTNHGQYYYGSDILGSVKFVTGQGGQEVKRIEYDVFGGIYKGNSPYGLETGYTGKPYGAVTSLSDYGFRDYSPTHARFITEDPIRDGENWFSYVGNNPVNWVDPDGLKYDEGPADQAYKDRLKYGKRSTSQRGRDFIKLYEKFKAEPYKPFPNSKPTIGYGHEIKKGEHFTKITEPEAMELFQKDIQWIEEGIHKNYEGDTSLTQQQFDALVSLGFNIGRGRLMGSKVFEQVQKGGKDANTILKLFRMHNTAKGKYEVGLDRRRFDEVEMYLYGDYKRDDDLVLNKSH